MAVRECFATSGSDGVSRRTRRVRSAVMEWDPWTDAGEQGLIVSCSPLVRGGRYFPDLHLVVLGWPLSESQRRTVLSHELAHHHLGHRPQDEWQAHRRQEVRADRWAAVRLVTVEALARAVIGASDWSEVAEELEVDPALLELRVRDMSEGDRAEVMRLVGGQEMRL